MEKERIQVISFDESNNGKYPVFFVGVFSDSSTDLLYNKKYLNKKNPRTKKASLDVFNKLDNRKYTFLHAEEDDYDRIAPLEFPGIVMASLADKELDNYVDSLYLLFDGELKTNQRLFTKELFNNLYGLEKKAINVWSGKDLDKKCYGVNLADKIAYYFFRYGGSAEKRSQLPQRKVFIK